MKLHHVLVRLTILIVTVFGVTRAHAQTDAVTDLAARLNRERLARGLAPLALNPKLTTAAQGHADDIARNRNFGHIGSDGSTATERIARAGYGKYSWGYRVGENWAHFRNAADAVAMWMESAPHRNNILHPVLREMGIGIAAVTGGNTIFVVDFGAQPNVLPIFINDGAAETSSPEVKLTLTSEEASPNGDGDAIGRPVQVQIANTPDFAGATWQPFATKINWTLAASSGVQTVYVKYRDAKGRTTTASALIFVSTANTAPMRISAAATTTRVVTTATPTRATPRPTLLPTLTPTARLTDTPTPTATVTPTATLGNTTDARRATSVADTPTDHRPSPAADTTTDRRPTLDANSPPTSVATEAAPPETRMDGLGLLVVVLVSLVLIRTWYSAGQ